MKIGIDVTSICRKITGIEYCALNLVKNLLRIDGANSYVIFFRKEIHPELAKFTDKAKFLVCPIDNQIFCEQVWLPYIAVKERVDLMHFPALPPGLLTLKPFAATIYDAMTWRYPQWFSWRSRCYTLPLFRLSARRAAHILTSSKHSKNELIEFAKVNKDKITVAHAAVDEKFVAAKNGLISRKVREKFNFSGSFILTVSSLDLVRNFERLLQAYALFSQDQPNPAHKLVLVGRRSVGMRKIIETTLKLGLQDRVILTGYVSDEDLVALYNLAIVFVYVPLYAGFGLPPLQAMACGTPVVTSNVASLPEVVGDAAVTVDPFNIAAIAAGLKEVTSNKKLRLDLIERGCRRVRLFNWKEAARKTVKVYEAIFKDELCGDSIGDIERPKN